MVKPRCILHIGMMKTGTTTLQRFLKDHTDALLANGWFYPGWPMRTGQTVRDAVARCPEGSNLIISDEGLWHTHSTTVETIHEIGNALSGFDVQVIVYLRRPDSFLNSLFRHVTRRFYGPYRIDRFLARADVANSLSFVETIDLYSNIFGEERLTVAPFDRGQFAGGDFLSDFESRTGLPIQDIQRSSTVKRHHHANVSPDADKVLLAGLLQSKYWIGDRALLEVLTAPRHSPGPSHTVFTTEELQRFADQYRPVFTELQNRFGTGAAPAFFSDWDVHRVPTSPFREIYDRCGPGPRHPRTRQAILHVGTLGTAGKDLRAALDANPTPLADHGFTYLGWPMRISITIARALQTVPSDRSVIISDEGLWHFANTTRSDTETIGRLLSRFDTKIVVTLHRPDRYVEAWFGQGLRAGTGALTVTDFLSKSLVNTTPFVPSEENPARFDCEAFVSQIDLSIIKTLETFADLFGDDEVIALPYEPGARTVTDPLGQILKITGVNGDVPLTPGRATEPLPSADRLLFATLLRQRYGIKGDTSALFTSPEADGADHGHLLHYDEASAINTALRPTFREIQRRWGRGPHDEFFADWEIDPDSYRVSALRSVYDRAMGND